MVGAYHESNTKPYDDAVAFVHEHKLESVVTFLHNVPYEDMPKLYQVHDLFVLPSVDEPFAISPLEAMNFGLPVIITDTNGARGCVRDGETGFVIPSNGQVTLTEKVELLLGDKTLLQTMGFNANKYVLEHHNSESFLRHLYIALDAAGAQPLQQSKK
jgi:glycosyltransferase involved in cell wall biosynthesis